MNQKWKITLVTLLAASDPLVPNRGSAVQNCVKTPPDKALGNLF